MKILFAITVFAAGIYLFIQQEGLDKISQYLPQYQIKQNAEQLLADVNKRVSKSVDENVDEKIKQFKVELLAKKELRINELEKQVANLQTQFSSYQSQQVNAKKVSESQLHNAMTNAPQDFLTEPTFAPTQYLSSEQPATELSESISAGIIKANPKQKAIKRQANLQDIADRMNKTSLLALTH